MIKRQKDRTNLFTPFILKIQGQKVVILKSIWFAPYDKQGRTNLSKVTKRQKGLYFIIDRNTRRLVYIGYSFGSLYKTLYRHFETWNHPGQPVVTYSQRSRYLISVVMCNSTKIALLERYYIMKLRPRDNIKQYSLDDLLDARITSAPVINTIDAPAPF